MSTFRRLLSCALLLSLATLAGCSLFSGDSPRERHGSRGGFTVRVDGPGLPAAATVAADLGAFAQRRGFVRQPARAVPHVDPAAHEPLAPAPERFLRENMVLEVSRQPADHRVTAYLQGSDPARGGKFISGFYRGFVQEYAGRYGGEDRFSESAYADDNSYSGTLGTLGPGAAPASNSPLESGVPPVSGAPLGAGAPSGHP